MAVVLDRSQRDAVYQFVLRDLADMDDVAIVLGDGEVELAQQLRRRFEQGLRLLDDIGWEQTGARELYALSQPPQELRAVFGWLGESATAATGEAIAESADQGIKEAFTAAETSKMVLQQLPEGTRRPRP